MKARKDTLVIVTAHKGNPPKACWGLATEQFPSEAWSVRIRDKKNIIVLPGQLIPVIQTDGSFKDPEKAARKLADQILIDILRKLFVQKEAEILLRLIQKDTLVIVLPDKNIPPKTCWGMVVIKMPSGKYDVVIGTSLAGLKADRIFAQPGQLIPVIQTDGSTKNPQRALRKNWDRILMHILLRFYSREGTQALQRLVHAMSQISDILLI